jgi:hypothetical protein
MPLLHQLDTAADRSPLAGNERLQKYPVFGFVKTN